MNLKARLYKILLLWSPSDEQQQTDYNWPLHIMGTNWFLIYNVWHWCVLPYTLTHIEMYQPTEDTVSEVRLKKKTVELTWES